MWRTSSQLVTQAVSTQTHQMARNSMAAWTKPSRSGWTMIVWETWVTANTKTRSKNNSTNPTRSSRPPSRSLSRLRFIAASIAGRRAKVKAGREWPIPVRSG